VSSAVEMTTASVQERTAEASRVLCAALGLVGLSATNMKYLMLALAEVADEEIHRNADFAARLRSRYEALVPARPSRAGRSSGASRPSRSSGPPKTRLTPVGTVDEGLLDPYAPPNPFLLQQLYGNEQLAAALGRHSLAALKQAVDVVQEQFPGTKPKKLTKPGIIDYIVEHVAGPGY
jgi:hypothetical protein